jgi:hypothetical protein
MENYFKSLEVMSANELLELMNYFIDELGQEKAITLIDKFYLNKKSRENQSSTVATESFEVSNYPKKQKNKNKVFDIQKYHQRHVAIQIQYEGGSYFGFASQAPGDCDETIEKHLFHALMKLKLIGDRKDCQYSRCGRTDRGVSALGQIIGLRVRSNLPENHDTSSIKDDERDDTKAISDKQMKSSSQSSSALKEIDYCGLLNRNLPDDIRAVGKLHCRIVL